MAIIKLSNKQLRLIQKSLDLYSRIGMLQLDEVLNHPTIDNSITEQFTDKKQLEVGDETMRGKIVEIGKSYIKTEGSWGNGNEVKKWKDVKNLKLSPDWAKLHDRTREIKTRLSEIKYLITGDSTFYSAYFGIHSKQVDETCREAYDIIQVIRHEFWKAQKDKSNYTVDSSISKSSMDDSVEVILDDIKDIRKQKINKLTN